MINRSHLNHNLSRKAPSLAFLKASGIITGVFFVVALVILTFSLHKKPPTMPHSEREIQNLARDLANGKTSGQLSPGAMLCLFKMGSYAKNN